jgi:hypothetical protein
MKPSKNQPSLARTISFGLAGATAAKGAQRNFSAVFAIFALNVVAAS